jgi:hypothetical protein|tara:strand:- start:4638 stop:5345 length:708 start_codon:yes stop_codon:yes gene_type:complete
MSVAEEDHNLLSKANSIKSIIEGSWRDISSKLSGLDIDEDDFKVIFSESKYVDFIFGERPANGWYYQRCMEALLPRFPSCGDYLINNCADDRIVASCLSSGFYGSVDIYNKVATFDHLPESQAYAAALCDIDTLKLLVKSKSSKIRSIAFQRLGPVECIDEMLSDSVAKNRAMGVQYAPYGYEKLTKMTNELARSVFARIVAKIDVQYLPMVLANRNTKNHWQSKIIEDRLNRGY